MDFQYYIKSDIGTTRSENQDSAYAHSLVTNSGEAFLGIVCDGMGGLSHGEAASRDTVRFFAEWFEEEFRYIIAQGDISELIAAQWSQLITAANDHLRSCSAHFGSMGTTLSVILIFCGRYYAAQIGDSRIYLLNGETAVQVTRDHSLVSEQIASGLLTEEEARSSPDKNVITRCIGVMEDVSADFYTNTVSGGVSFLICSDGFHGHYGGAE
ncbi:MAG: PP2C family protein-serine/threonine phosphatase, partial [Oscillospiraceae bacterium]